MRWDRHVPQSQMVADALAEAAPIVDPEAALKLWGLTIRAREWIDVDAKEWETAKDFQIWKEWRDPAPSETRAAIQRAASGENPMLPRGDNGSVVSSHVEEDARRRAPRKGSKGAKGKRCCGMGGGIPTRDPYAGPRPSGDDRHISDPDQRFFIFISVERALVNMGGHYRNLAIHLYAMRQPARLYAHKGWHTPKTREKNVSILRREIRRHLIEYCGLTRNGVS